MKTKFDISKNQLVELDVYFNGIIKSAKYLTISIKSGEGGYIKLLPLKEYFKKNTKCDFIIPCIDMPFSMIIDCKKLDNLNLLYLIDSGNPHILGAIQGMLGGKYE